jgi:dTDP-4-dehydrorhamnose reductase
LGASGALGRAVATEMAPGANLVLAGHTQAGPGLRPVDLRVQDQVRALVRETRPDVVVLAAAYRDPDFCEQNPDEARRLNVEPVRVLCDVLPAEAQLVFVSSDYVFDGTRPPYREDDPVSPVNLYGRTKCEAEALLRGRARSLVVRPPLLCSAGSDGKPYGFIGEILKALREPSRQVLDDVLLRCPTWTRDVAKVIRFLVDRGAEGIVHVRAPRAQSRFAWTAEAGAMMRVPTDHLVPSKDIVPRPARRPIDCSLSGDKLRRLGYSPLTDFRDVLRAVLPDVFR